MQNLAFQGCQRTGETTQDGCRPGREVEFMEFANNLRKFPIENEIVDLYHTKQAMP